MTNAPGVSVTKKSLLAAVLYGVLSIPVYADTIECPDLASAVKAGACPTEDELKYTYTGYCADNARIYKNDNEACVDYREYRAMKNVALWESGDGAFHAYVSCDMTEKMLRTARAVSVSVSRKSGMTRLVCGYGDGLTFVHRTRAECKPRGAETCSGKTCVADCEAAQ